MFENPESGIDSLLGELNCAANFINSSSFNSLLANWQEFTSQQLFSLAGETLIQGWQNQYEPSQALVYAAGSIFKSDFAANAQIAFGDAFDVNQAEALGAEILGGNYGLLPDLQFLSDANMNGALGAYANSTNTIYINRDFLTQSSDNPIAIAKILVEEAGHFLDAYASDIDSPGDEGEILTDLISGQQLTVDELTQLRAEDDSTTIVLNGQFLEVEQRANKDDFNGDRISDILFRNGTNIGVWLVNSNGQLAAATMTGSAPVEWQVQGTGDFNGDGISDILFRNGTNIGVWLVNSNGQLATATMTGSAPVEWQIQGTGDFNGDGISDILFRNGTSIGVWLVNSNGQLATATMTGSAPIDWQFQGTGDFNGDGISDILLRNSTSIDAWLVNSNGRITTTTRVGNAPVDWQIQGTGDFNGDRVSGILLRNGTSIDAWLVNSHAQITTTTRVGNAPVDWQVQLTPVNLIAPLGLMTSSQKLTALINGQLNGVSLDVDGYCGAQCWDLVAYATGNNTSTYNWKCGENVMANGNIAIGTAIATFLGPNHTYDTPPNYSSQHTAIFAGYGVEYGVAGFYVWDQNWNWQPYVQKHFIRSNGSGTSDADNYYVIQV
ncbi:VCBS repeat-containing protein [Calothrix sp. FACHB-1219]|uniref:BPSL0067 family protein n=1 Tax=Calothrix sp. FACHB-1219 TaxID=2692778 RepID=UPI0016822413|nr:BPSL0067 family protein [Calothrix sp. FACHB-1219]MBD2221761.1 VCBS repeat-containing protein [Calothrix sp. FACHB-1219]